MTLDVAQALLPAREPKDTQECLSYFGLREGKARFGSHSQQRHCANQEGVVG